MPRDRGLRAIERLPYWRSPDCFCDRAETITPEQTHEAGFDVGDEIGTREDKGGIELDQARTRADLGIGIRGAPDPADADQR